MTNVPFVALMLIACYRYMRGLRSAGWGWLLARS